MSLKRVVILGGGESGVGAAVLAKKQGYEAFLSDKGELKDKYQTILNEYSIEYEFNQHTNEKILNADLIIKSPGIPDKVEIVQKARNNSISVVSEIEFAAQFTKGKLIGITGSNGKTTTTLLTYHILKNAGMNVGLAGNIGQSFAYQVATDDKDIYVLELSSFQLDGMYHTNIDYAYITNITPDHLDRYDYKFENYVASKFRILNNHNKSQVFICNIDDQVIQDYIKKHPIQSSIIPISTQSVLEGDAAWADYKQQQININTNQKLITMTIEELALQGRHNVYNSMAAGMIAKLVDVRKETIRDSLMDFRNAEHRLEFVAKVHGVEYINDSKATNVNSVWYALESMKNPVVLIIGGVDKGNDYSEILDLVKEKVKAIVCLGKDNSKIHEAFGKVIDIIVDTQSAEEAVAASYKLAKNGDTVLLSPACASFDLFENYEDRGHQFKQAVRAL
jgi:UDP-N-acetylmuramoylalanine--D-glutamate ligase